MPKKPYDQEQSLMVKTQKLLLEDGRDPIHLFVEFDIPYYWLKKFMAGSIKNPSVNRVQYLYEKLAGKSLTI